VIITTEPFASALLIDVNGVIGVLPEFVGEDAAGDVSVGLDTADVTGMVESTVLIVVTVGGGGGVRGGLPVLGALVVVALLVEIVVLVLPLLLSLLLLLPPLLLLPLFVVLDEVLEGENGGGTVVDEPPELLH